MTSVVEQFSLAEPGILTEANESLATGWLIFGSGLMLEALNEYSGPKEKASLRDTMVAVESVLVPVADLASPLFKAFEQAKVCTYKKVWK